MRSLTRTRRAAATALGAVAFLAVSAQVTPASALEARGTGVHGWTSAGGRVMNVADTKGDSRSVKAEYRRAGSRGTVRTLVDSHGNGTVTRSGSGSRIVSMKVCRINRLWPDECTGWTP